MFCLILTVHKKICAHTLNIGGAYMCRTNQMIAVGLMSFGLGVLIGTMFSSGLLRFILGFGTIAVGFFLLQKK